MITQSERYSGGEGVVIEVAVPSGKQGLATSHQFLTTLEKQVKEAGSYRGKVISLEQTSSYSGQAGSIMVHKLHAVSREQLILPKNTVQLLERNVTQFIEQRPRLKKLGMPIKKGLLLYGPPGTGKTHTIHYLASQLPDHTTLLITAAQVGLLAEYFQLARFLQPAIIVIEDADLIARDRTQMDDPCEEALLNRLLNEMDGLRQDAAILFILTTNRPDQIEAALAARPGRIDQAIEFPLPDATGRALLIKLYSCGLDISASLLNELVERTDGASPAFFKELMRRAAQHYLQEGARQLKKAHFDTALEDMLLHGGSLNIKLLGGRLKV